MLAISQGRLNCLSTPFGKRGFFFDEWTDGGDDSGVDLFGRLRHDPTVPLRIWRPVRGPRLNAWST